MVSRKAAGVILGVLLVLGCAGMASAQQSLQLPSVVTVGLGYVIVPTDQVVVTLGIETSSESADQAYSQSNAIIESIRAELQEANIEGLNISVGRVNMWQQRSSTRPTTYRTTSTMTVAMTHESHVGMVIDTAVRLGATSVQSVKFQASNLQEAAQNALTLAVKNAMEKAEAIVKATETRIVTIRQVTDSNKVQIYNPSDPVLVEVTRTDETPYQVPVERGQVLVQVEVTMEFEVAAR